MLTTVYLHGKAGKLFGTIWQLDIERVSEAIRAICFMKPEFRQFLQECHDKGVGFRVSTDAGVLNEDQLWLPATKEIHIRPVVLGSKRAGVFQTILGIVLIIVSLYMANGAGIKAGWAAFQAGNAGFAATFVMSTGIAMMVGGVSTLIANPGAEDFFSDKDEKRSYLFNGPSRSTSQGIALPVGYGRLFVSGIPVSADMVNAPLHFTDNYGGDMSGNEPYMGGSPTNPMGGTNPDLNYYGWVPSGGPGAPGTPSNPFVPPTFPELPDSIDDTII